ncbi:MAG: ATP-grasp domain-containing protein [Patescibacteria group bacterium]
MPESKPKNIILYVMNLPPGTVEAVRAYEAEFGGPLRIMLLRDSRVRDVKGFANTPGLDIYETCDFSKPGKIAETLLPYQDELLAVTCRSEQSLARFAQIIPHVPYLRTPSTESLAWAADKYEMRKRLRLYEPKINPRFTLAKNNTKVERERISQRIGFPMIVKPANMVGSLFVSVCYHEDELEQTLRTLFRRIKRAYQKDNRIESPRIVVEEYMEGEYYSVDSYVNSRGSVTHCPLVKQVTGRNIGHDDFYNYLQLTPTGLKKATVERAQATVEKAIHALGLRSTLTHTELIKIDDEWKVVEIGARMGGFRHMLHKLSCDINHALNDVLVRIPKPPVVPKKCRGYACSMKWFAAKEGKITKMKGVKKIESLESFHRIDVNKRVGDRAIFARNGGRSIFNLTLYNADRSKLLADIRRVEKMIEIKVATRGSGGTAAATQSSGDAAASMKKQQATNKLAKKTKANTVSGTPSKSKN